MSEKAIIAVLGGLACVCLAFTGGYFLGGRDDGEMVLLSGQSSSLTASEPILSEPILSEPVSSEIPAESSVSAEDSPEVTEDAPVNVNTASEEELCALPGIGKATARKIILYRTENGPFMMKEELMNVSGIGEKKYAVLEPLVAVE